MKVLKIPPLMNKFSDTIWEYDVDTNEVYLHHDNMTPELCGCWIPYDEISALYQKKYIYHLDREIWNHFLTPEAMRQFADKKMEENHFYIRFEHTQKGREWHEVYIQYIGNNRLLLASRDVKEMQRNAMIAQAVMPEFDYVCCIDIVKQSYVLYYAEADKTIVPQNASDNYHKILEEFNQAYVVPEEVDKLTEQMRLENVLEKLKDQDQYILYATMKDQKGLTYKKLCFFYESQNKNTLLLTRIDIGEIVRERKRRENEEMKRLRYLENMPVAFCSTEVLVDETGKPYDFVFTYSNRAHAELEGVKEGELIGKRFYEFFHETDPTWLNYYYETAYKGINHIIRRYSPEIQKHLLIYTFQSELGHCECALLDVSEEYFLTQELQQSREDMKRILEMTTDFVFQYWPERGEVLLPGREKDDVNRVLEEIVQKEKLGADYSKVLKESFVRIDDGEHYVNVVIQGKIREDNKWNWYRVTMFDFQDGYTHERKVLGFLQNIDQYMSREEELRKKAQIDSLTGIFNSGTGKHEVCKRLEQQRNTDSCYNAMFVMDIDDFKHINDENGHLIGDNVLKEFAKTLRKTFRVEDIIYRLGGDEFVVFVENIHEPEQNMGVILQRFYEHIEEVKERYPFFGCSVGIFITDRERTFEEYYTSADHALYETKNKGKGYYTIKKE